jgi:hypothetical protein
MNLDAALNSPSVDAAQREHSVIESSIRLMLIATLSHAPRKAAQNSTQPSRPR